jgi:hypothetical protein
MASTAIPLAWSIRAWGSIKLQRLPGIPVLLKPSTVINIPQKNTRREYETWSKQLRVSRFLLNQILHGSITVNCISNCERNLEKILVFCKI